MFKVIFLLALFFVFTNCSLDTKSGIWKNKKKPKITKKVSEIKFTNNLTFDQFKKNAVVYGQLSEFPTLDK
tara:strand:- start:200 stop:412 length:213 start_codon:yes stop_codon:yes gene_type:complete